MILCVFYIIIFDEIPCKIDTNHNRIDLSTVSPQWSCGMMLTLCVMSSNCVRVSFRAWKVGEQN